jgi:hypothetical protein
MPYPMTDGRMAVDDPFERGSPTACNGGCGDRQQCGECVWGTSVFVTLVYLRPLKCEGELQICNRICRLGKSSSRLS